MEPDLSTQCHCFILACLHLRTDDFFPFPDFIVNVDKRCTCSIAQKVKWLHRRGSSNPSPVLIRSTFLSLMNKDKPLLSPRIPRCRGLTPPAAGSHNLTLCSDCKEGFYWCMRIGRWVRWALGILLSTLVLYSTADHTGCDRCPAAHTTCSHKVASVVEIVLYKSQIIITLMEGVC